MKKKFIGLFGIIIIVGNSISVQASVGNIRYMSEVIGTESEQMTESESSYDTYVDLSDVDVNDIQTDCSDIEIMDVASVENNTDLAVVGSSEYDSSSIQDIGEASVDVAIVIDDTAIPLYPTFDNALDAMATVKSDCSSVLDILAQVYSLEELSDSNWTDYYKYMYEYLDSVEKADWYNDENSEFIELDNFFDIYENSDKNNELVSVSADVSSISELASDEEFIYQLPYDAVEDLSSGIDEASVNNEQLKAVSATNLTMTVPLTYNKTNSPYNTKLMSYNSSDGINYAIKYASSYNHHYGYIWGNDCTNFASQILVAAGKTQNKTWYFEPGFGYYSTTWCNADYFANYWGVDYKYSSFKDFSAKLSKGNFICYDKQNDKDWDHMGYIVSKKSTYSSSLGYTNFKVAQHSKNYNAWVSSATNGWDTLKSSYPNVRFGIIKI